MLLTYGPLALVAAFLGWYGYVCLGRNENPRRLVARWVLSALLLAGFWRMALVIRSGSMAAPYALMGAILFAALLGLTWASSIGEILASPLTNLYTGGAEVESRPLYSMAEARRKRGEIQEAVAEIRSQLQRFPNDHTGILMLASIQAEELRDLPAAEETVLTYVGVANLEPGQAAGALTFLADMHLKHANNPAAARECLERIIRLLPDTEHSTNAANRVAHLAAPGEMQSRLNPALIGVKHVPLKVGLSKQGAAQTDEEQIAAVELEIEQRRATLELHPLDFDTREQLATLLAEHHRAVEEARREIEFMIRQPTATPRQIKKWLNLEVDLEAKFGAYSTQAEEPLRRLIRMYPGSAAAEVAQTRLGSLKKEFRQVDHDLAVQLGDYEKDLGLRSGRAPGESG
jgi:tetratricopeptide (TPR) repeat protein